MRSIHSVLAFAALTTVSVAAHAGELQSEVRPIETVTTPTTVATEPTTGAASTPNPSMTPERPDYAVSPQARDDGEIEYRLMVRMSAIDPLRLGDVHVHCVRGAVTLYGTVPDQASHDRALIMTNAFDGVRVVRDELDTRTRTQSSARGGGPVDDTTLAADVTRALRTNSGVITPISVTSQRGVITLRGTVATFADARRALAAAKTIPGVVAVRPALQVNSQRIVSVDADANARRR